MASVPLQMVPVMYSKEGQVGAVPLVSVAFGPDGRRLSLGSHANGDLFEVPIQDVIANPGTLLAPCGKPYAVNGGVVDDPCGENRPESVKSGSSVEPSLPPLLADAYAEFTDLFGSEKAADELIAAGVYSTAAVKELDQQQLADLVGKRAMNAYGKQVESLLEGSEPEDKMIGDPLDDGDDAVGSSTKTLKDAAVKSATSEVESAIRKAKRNAK